MILIGQQPGTAVLNELKKMLSLRRMLQSGDPSLKVFLIGEDHHLTRAKTLHAQVYLAHGYVTSEQVDARGIILPHHDPHQDHATYFAVARGADETVIATARQIRPRPEAGHLSFPTMAKLEIDEPARGMIEALGPEECVEISALVKQAGASSYASFLLYRTMWQHSLRSGHKRWIMACDRRLYGRLKFLFGDALERIGPDAYYMGSWVVPASLSVGRSLEVFRRGAKSPNPVLRALHRQYIRFFLEGLGATP